MGLWARRALWLYMAIVFSEVSRGRTVLEHSRHVLSELQLQMLRRSVFVVVVVVLFKSCSFETPIKYAKIYFRYMQMVIL